MAKVDWLIGKLSTMPVFAFDTETSGVSFLNDYIFCISFSWVEGLGVCIDFRDFSETDQEIIWDKLREVFNNKARKIAQNGVFDVKFLWKKNIGVRNWYMDTILMAHLLDENDLVGLGPLAHRYTDMGGYHDVLDDYVEEHPNCDPTKALVGDTWKKRKDADKKFEKYELVGSYTRIPREMLDVYACQDADVTLRVWAKMLPLLQKESLIWILLNIQMPIQKVLARVEYSGVSVDREYLEQLYVDYKKRMDEAWEKVLKIPEVQELESDKKGQFYSKWDQSKRIKQKMGAEAYVNKHEKDWRFKASTKQLEELIVGKLHQKPIKFGKQNKKTGVAQASMDAAVLAAYALILPQVEVIQEHRTLQHLNGTFIEGMLKRIGKDGRIRSNYPLFRTVTGRVASNDPNLNNIPRKAVEIKYQFIADPGCFMVEADYSQAEFRHWAHYSQDPQMLYDINHGIDIHKLTAAMGKGVKIPEGNISLDDFKEWTKDITKEERNVAKTVVFGMMYGRGPRSIALGLKITEKEARNIIMVFFKRYPVAKAWLNTTTSQAKIDGYVRDLYGRKRRLTYINKLDEKHKEMAAKAERMAVNAPIQGGASDTTFLAAIRIDNEMMRRHMKSRMILTVYDSLDYNVIPEELKDMLRLIHTEMLRKTEWIKVNLDCEVKVGRTWGKLEEVRFTGDHEPKLEDVKILQPT
jgi:DNA polymerase-1